MPTANTSFAWMVAAGTAATATLVTTTTAALVLLLRRVGDSVGLAAPSEGMEQEENPTKHCALLRHLPNVRLAWRSLGAITPTPLHLCTLPRSHGDDDDARETDNRLAQFWVKREDLICTDTYAGNKVRTLQHQLAVCEVRREAGETAFRQLVTLGTGGSNQIVATVVHASPIEK